MMKAEKTRVYIKYSVIAVAFLITTTAFAEVASFVYKEDDEMNEINSFNILKTFYSRFEKTYKGSNEEEFVNSFETGIKEFDLDSLGQNLGLKYNDEIIQSNDELSTSSDFSGGYEDLLKIIIEKPSTEGNSGDEEDNDNNLPIVDKVYNAKGNDGSLNCPVKVESVPLNVIGHANINVLKGAYTIEERPVFDGMCVGDKAAFAIVSMSLAFMVKTIITLKLIGFTINGAFNVAKGIVKGILTAAKLAVKTSKVGFDLGKIPGFSVAALTIWSSLSEEAKNKIINFVDGFITGIVNIVEPFVSWLQDEWHFGYFVEEFLGLIEGTIFEQVLDYVIDAGTNVILLFFTVFQSIKELIHKNWDQIIDFLITAGIVISNVAINLFKSFFAKVKKFASNVFGKSEVFVTGGDQTINLNNLYMKLASNTQFNHFAVKYYDEQGVLRTEDKAVAIIEVKPYSKENEFDSQHIAIKYERDFIYDEDEDNSAPSEPCLVTDNIVPQPAETKISFDIKASDPDNDKIRFFIDWADGGDEEFTQLYESDQTVKLSHSYSSSGAYSIVIGSCDEHGARSKTDLELDPITIEEESIPRIRIFQRFEFLNRFF